jgi:N-terminal domain of anti-restriction factor ArdC
MDYQQKWSDLLIQAVTKPGLILKAYSAFHGYSIANQIAAMIQCGIRGIEPGPINTFVGWKGLGRYVKKGERALTLCMPLCKKKKDAGGNTEESIMAFIWANKWFVMSQTEGDSIPTIEIPTWNKERALAALHIAQVEFTHTDGNALGFARKRELAISPLAPLPHKTLFHELGHIELGHTLETAFSDVEQIPRSLREVEAEAVSLLLCGSLDLEGAEYCRGYIQSWLKDDSIPEKSAQKIFGAADRILRAGREQ